MAFVVHLGQVNATIRTCKIDVYEDVYNGVRMLIKFRDGTKTSIYMHPDEAKELGALLIAASNIQDILKQLENNAVKT